MTKSHPGHRFEGRHAGTRLRAPVFIGGMFKSGTSLLRAMLGLHSQIFAGLETQWLTEEARIGDTIQRREWLERLSIFFDVPCSSLEEVLGDELQIEACLDHLMDFVARREGKSRWAEKTPHNVGNIDRILSYWPDAKVLHIVRDPRDVYASLVEIGKWPEPTVFARHWCNTVGAGRDWINAAGGKHPSYHEIRYEELVLAPEATMQKILQFLGEAWESQLATFVGRPQDFERVLRATGKLSPTLKRLAQPLTYSRVGVWRSIVGQERWRPAEAELARHGYHALVKSLIRETDLICADTVAGT